jgi:hypothetical protein
MWIKFIHNFVIIHQQHVSAIKAIFSVNTIIIINIYGNTMHITDEIATYIKWTCCKTYLFVCFRRNSPQWAMASSFTTFLDHTQRRTAEGRTSLEEWSARRKDLYLTTHNTHNRQTSMPPVGFESYNPSKREAADLRLIPRGHWDRHKT